MIQRTHLGINAQLCGTPLNLSDGVAEVSLSTTSEMRADDHGLVHGGFVFGLADYAAMLAVNDPLVVLGAANTRFLAPVRVGDVVVAHAARTDQKGRKHTVLVTAQVNDTVVFTGEFTTFVLDQHVLSTA